MVVWSVEHPDLVAVDDPAVPGAASKAVCKRLLGDWGGCRQEQGAGPEGGLPHSHCLWHRRDAAVAAPHWPVSVCRAVTLRLPLPLCFKAEYLESRMNGLKRATLPLPTTHLLDAIAAWHLY